MNLEDIIRLGIEHKATDIHLEARAPVTFRVNGGLKRIPGTVEAAALRSFASKLLGEEQTQILRTRGSVDLCRVISGVQCRINVMKSDHGTGFAIRLLSSTASSLATCNLHPCLRELVDRDSGLVILTGPTGSGKSTTLAALIDEINERDSRHIITLESPIEYRHTAKKSLIRQREIGAHTPSYEQGLLDALREDPDVLVVGEMRDPEAMRLTLNAAETGHLVLATMHSASAVEAVYRMMMSFPPERQANVLAQIADTLVAIVSQKITFRPDEKILVPCCEILVGTYSTRNVIRKGDISKLPSILQTGGPEGMYTFERYQAWLDARTEWQRPPPPQTIEVATGDYGDDEPIPIAPPAFKGNVEGRPRRLRQMPPPADVGFETEAQELAMTAASDVNEATPASVGSRKKTGGATGKSATRIHKDGRIEIPEMDLDLDELVKEFKSRSE